VRRALEKSASARRRLNNRHVTPFARSSNATLTPVLMRDLIDLRLTELRAELDSGRRLQAELDARQEELGRSMLRISGAIQVLGELSAAADGEAPAQLRRVVDK
jgi:hypothetical protein